MGFDIKRYLAAKMEPRTATVDLSALKAFFAEDDELTWTVRGLTADELAKAKGAEEKERSRIVGALTQALSGGKRSEMTKAMLDQFGYSDDPPPVVIRNLELVTMGCVEPECSMELARKLSKDHPVPFNDLANTILYLTGQGAAEAEKKPDTSGQSAKSGPA